MKGHTGRIRTTTTIAKAGNVTKGIGTTRTTTTAIGATMIMGGGIAITKTATNPVMRLTKIVVPLRLGVPHAIPQRELIVLLDEQLDALQKECFGGTSESDLRAYDRRHDRICKLFDQLRKQVPAHVVTQTTDSGVEFR